MLRVTCDTNTFVTPASDTPPCRDPDDVAIMGTALAGQVPYLVTSDKDLYDDAVQLVTEAGKASASLLQRRLRVGYARAARLLDILEENGVVGPQDGAKPRDILIGAAEASEMAPSKSEQKDEDDSDIRFGNDF